MARPVAGRNDNIVSTLRQAKHALANGPRRALLSMETLNGPSNSLALAICTGRRSSRDRHPEDQRGSLTLRRTQQCRHQVARPGRRLAGGRRRRRAMGPALRHAGQPLWSTRADLPSSPPSACASLRLAHQSLRTSRPDLPLTGGN